MPGIEDVKRFWDAQPCNIRHSNKPVGSPAYFEDVRRKKYFVEPHIPRFAQFDRWRDMQVLEIGCGIGTDTIEFALHGANVTAVDISQRSIDIAKIRTHVYSVADKVKFYCGDAEYLSEFISTKQKFDLIYAFGSIHHTPSPRNVFHQLSYHAYADTVLKVMLYNRWSIKTLQMWWTKHGTEAQAGCPVAYTYTPLEVEMLMLRYGWNVDKIDIEHIFPYCIPEYKSNIYKKHFIFRKMPKSWFKFLERHWGWHICATGHRRA